MRIRLKQTVRFVDSRSVELHQPEVTIHASNETQVVPDWIARTDEFAMLEDSGHVEVVSSPARTINSPSAADLGGATGIAGSGIPQGSDADPTKPGNEENQALVESLQGAQSEIDRLRAQVLEFSKKAQADLEGLDKSSGIDGPTGDWTKAGQDESGFPVAKGSPTDVTATPADKAKYTRAQKASTN